MEQRCHAGKTAVLGPPLWFYNHSLSRLQQPDPHYHVTHALRTHYTSKTDALPISTSALLTSLLKMPCSRQAGVACSRTEGDILE